MTIGSTKSDDIVIAHGVLQGSVLGPLLFLFYINDFRNCSQLFDFHIFADDTNLFYSNRSLTELEDDVFFIPFSSAIATNFQQNEQSLEPVNQ